MEQKNTYQGTPPRAWLRLRLKAIDGTEIELNLLADSGNPYAIVLSQARMAQLETADGPDVKTNFGLLEGGWLQLAMPEFGLGHDVLGYGSDAVVRAAQASRPDFEGLVGLPFLRLLEYGGDADFFWIRKQ